MKLKPLTQGQFLRGLVAASSVLSQSKGSVPRLSNMLLTKRGSLVTCDGSQLIHAFNGALQSGRGKVTCTFLFQPTGVSSYYLAIIKALDIPLGAPKNLTGTGASGGSLVAFTYYYVVTAIDGAGGETTISNEVAVVVPANGKATLNWNIVPNAQGYNVYRSTTPGTEVLLAGSGTAILPAPQSSAGNLTVSFVDDGTTSTVLASYNLLAAPSGANLVYVSPFKNYYFQTTTPPAIKPGQNFTVTGCTPGLFNQSYICLGVGGTTVTAVIGGVQVPNQSGGGGTLNIVQIPPISDTTQQCALFKMPLIVGSPSILPVAYNNGNIVALYPADFRPSPDGGGGGGSGGGGGTGGGGSSGGGATPSGGIPGVVTALPQMVQFVNRVAIALGNGFTPQLFSDSATLTNPATTAPVSAISVDAFGVVTVTTSAPHGLTAAQVGGNVVISGVINGNYNFVGPTLSIVSTTQYKVRNLAAIGQAASSGGTSTTTSVPIVSTFVPAFPTWSATTNYTVNSVVQPTAANGFYYTAIQGGTSGAAQPTFPTVIGQQVADGSAIWKCTAATNTSAPPPPGASHIGVYSGALFVLNTSPTPTSNGLDGPTALRMSDINNPNSWNPINVAFLDKDDGTEGMGLSSFTITAQGIPPEGSLIAFKNYATYQIIGIFGAANFAIQRTKSSMGCLAPRSIQFVSGYGLIRFAHLGFAVFDGVDDRVISEEVRPYEFPSTFLDDADITVLDATWQSLMWGFQTAQPALFCAAIPVGVSGGQLTRILCYDLVLKAWAGTVDLPFAISSAAQFSSFSANPVTVFGGFSDGMICRWQAGDVQWDTGGSGARTPSNVTIKGRTPTAASQNPDQPLFIRRLMVRGINTNSTQGLTVTLRLDGVPQPSYTTTTLPIGDFQAEIAVDQTVRRIEADWTGAGDVEVQAFTWFLVPKPAGRPLVIA